jgi:hypothetical protein
MGVDAVRGFCSNAVGFMDWNTLCSSVKKASLETATFWHADKAKL